MNCTGVRYIGELHKTNPSIDTTIYAQLEQAHGYTVEIYAEHEHSSFAVELN
jgi:hypothetical protein